jgi:hypothetical protein
MPSWIYNRAFNRLPLSNLAAVARAGTCADQLANFYPCCPVELERLQIQRQVNNLIRLVPPADCETPV